MKRILSVLLIFMLLLFPTSCGKAKETTASQTFFVMDTFLTVTLYESDDATSLFKGANDIAVAIEKKASRTLDGSEVTAFNRAKASYTFSDDMAEILEKALAMCEETEGAYDITVAPLVDLWQIKEGGPVPSDEALSEALSHVSYQKLTLSGNTLEKSDPDVMIDLGSVAKGYALGKIAEFLESNDAVGIVNFGGNVALVGQKSDKSPWTVSLRDPFSQGTAGRFTLSSGVVAVSGDYERYFEEDGVRYHHILSPFDGMPIKGVHSVAVYASDATEADMLSTALFVMGEERAREFCENRGNSFAYVMTLSKDEIIVSEGAKAIFTP